MDKQQYLDEVRALIAKDLDSLPNNLIAKDVAHHLIRVGAGVRATVSYIAKLSGEGMSADKMPENKRLFMAAMNEAWDRGLEDE